MLTKLGTTFNDGNHVNKIEIRGRYKSGAEIQHPLLFIWFRWKIMFWTFLIYSDKNMTSSFAPKIYIPSVGTYLITYQEKLSKYILQFYSKKCYALIFSVWRLNNLIHHFHFSAEVKNGGLQFNTKTGQGEKYLSKCVQGYN